MVEPWEEPGLLGRLHRLVGPEVPQRDLLQDLPGRGGEHGGTWSGHREHDRSPSGPSGGGTRRTWERSGHGEQWGPRGIKKAFIQRIFCNQWPPRALYNTVLTIIHSYTHSHGLDCYLCGAFRRSYVRYTTLRHDRHIQVHFNQSMYCLKCSLTIVMVSEHFWRHQYIPSKWSHGHGWITFQENNKNTLIKQNDA